MSIKRKPFFIKGNFQLGFIVSFLSLLLAGTCLSIFIMYEQFSAVFDKVAFSAHLNYSNSGQLILGFLIKLSLVMAVAIVVIGTLIAVVSNLYFERFFNELSKGLRHLLNKNYSYRIKLRGRYAGKDIIKAFNVTAVELAKTSHHHIHLAQKAISILHRNDVTKEEIHPINEQLRKIHPN